MTHIILFTLLVILCSLNHAASEVYYINSSNFCTVQPCLSLSQFAANSSHYLHSNTTLVFLPGTHYLSTDNLMLSNMDNFAMKSENSTAQIKCTNDSHIHFSQSQCIHITNLEFIGCGGNQVKHLQEFVIKDAKFEGQENSETALELIGTTAQILNSVFVSNRNGSNRQCTTLLNLDSCDYNGFIGGAIIAINSTIDISQSKFEANRADFGGAMFAVNSVINVSGNTSFINNTAISFGGVILSYNSDIIMNESIFHHNIAGAGGVLWSYGNITIEASEFDGNNGTFYGGVLHSHNSTIIIKASEFHHNIASIGGVLWSFYGTITIEASEFDGNNGTYGGVLHSQNSTIIIKASEFFYSTAAYYGGVLYVSLCEITIESSEFDDSFSDHGGVLFAYSCAIRIESSEFDDSFSDRGGVLFAYSCAIRIESSEFNDNNANITGVLYFSNSTITIGSSNFSENSSPIGAVIYAIESSIIEYRNNLLVENNTADRYAVIYLSNSEFRGHDSGNFTFSNNLGSLVAFNSKVTFGGYATFVNNQPLKTTSRDFQEGGALTLFQSNVFFDGECDLEQNHAENGGAIHSTESKLYVNGDVTITHNTATGNGGGVYLSFSELNCQQKSTGFRLFNNAAVNKGGGLHAISSSIRATSIYTGAKIHFTKNTAKFGGGLSLEANAKLYILKYDEHINTDTAIFTANSADYGGAVYVDDDTNSGTCASEPKTECFFQVLAIYHNNIILIGSHNHKLNRILSFSRNSASISGNILYGGLLDRCAVSPFAEYDKHASYEKDRGVGIAYLKNVSMNITNISISSEPVRVCLCTDNTANCTSQSLSIKIKKGETFQVSLVAVDQMDQPVNATIQTSLHFTESGLAEGQLARPRPAECTNLTFNVVSPNNSENLTLYASDGPCKDAELSTATVEIDFLPCSCPIGLQVSGMNKTNCIMSCECHSNISQYVEQCDGLTGSLVKTSQSRAWIFYINDTDPTGYLVYPNCPFDYCLLNSSDLEVNLNQPNGADAQCAFNRSSLLCGSCQPGLSLSLGSSHCLQCPSHWPALLIAVTIAAILAGIALVALLLALNMTVAVGTLNGIIFYANVVYANKSILLPFQETNFITLFISWLNLELGIDTCYFPGLDTYTKTWLQLAFPAYVILLVVLVIISSSYSTKFSNLIGKKNPVATLATLILLSYAKFLEVCFKSLSVGILVYPDGSSKMLWLPDATVKYLSGKHVPLFITAVLILLVGLVYTAFLFSWQWLLYLPKWRIFKWSRNPKIQTFIETYNTPYTPKHRYWTGLLLIVRIVLYLVAAVNILNDPTVALTAIIFTVCCIFALRLFFGTRLYRKWPLDVLETFFYLNILSFATFTWYSHDNPDSNQEPAAAAYTSVIIAFLVLLLIILYHVYTYTNLFSKFKKTMLGRMIDRLFTDATNHQKPKPRQCCFSPPPDDDIHRFDEVLYELDCPVNTDDYNSAPLRRSSPVQPTYSVVEVHHPCLSPPDPEGANAENMLPDSQQSETTAIKLTTETVEF